MKWPRLVAHQPGPSQILFAMPVTAAPLAMRVIGYRIDHGLPQSGLGRLLGMHQPAIVRLEASDHEPALAPLSRLARILGLEFHIHITSGSFELRDTA